MSVQARIVDAITVALDSRGHIDTALEVIRIASETAGKLGGDVEDNVQSVKMALIKALSGPDGELYSSDDLLPEPVMRDLVDVLNTGLVEQLVKFFTLKKRFGMPGCLC